MPTTSQLDNVCSSPGPTAPNRRSCPPKIVEAVRALIEGTALSQREIAARTGVCPHTVSNLKQRHGWTRPNGRPVRGEARRECFPRLAAAMAAARPLVEGTVESEGAIARRLGVDRGSVARWRKLYGWTRPAGAPTFLPGPRADGQSRPVRSRLRRGKPYMTDAVEGARTLLMMTLLSQKAIAKQLGVSQWWVGDILRRRGWERPGVPAWSRRFAAGRRVGTLASEGDRRGRPYAPALRREARAMWELTLLPTALIAARIGVGPSTVARWAQADAWERPTGRVGARQLRGYFGAMRKAAGRVRR